MNSYPHHEQYADLACASAIAVHAFANRDCTEVELLRLRPCPLSQSDLAKLESRWNGRGLRAVGVLGLVDGTPKTMLSVLLAPDEFSRLMAEFRFFVSSFIDIAFDVLEERVIHQGLFAEREQIATAEVTELEHMLSLVDPRPN
jgi:hypothetical protein